MITRLTAIRAASAAPALLFRVARAVEERSCTRIFSMMAGPMASFNGDIGFLMWVSRQLLKNVLKFDFSIDGDKNKAAVPQTFPEFIGGEKTKELRELYKAWVLTCFTEEDKKAVIINDPSAQDWEQHFEQITVPPVTELTTNQREQAVERAKVVVRARNYLYDQGRHVSSDDEVMYQAGLLLIASGEMRDDTRVADQGTDPTLVPPAGGCGDDGESVVGRSAQNGGVSSRSRCSTPVSDSFAPAPATPSPTPAPPSLSAVSDPIFPALSTSGLLSFSCAGTPVSDPIPPVPSSARAPLLDAAAQPGTMPPGPSSAPRSPSPPPAPLSPNHVSNPIPPAPASLSIARSAAPRPLPDEVPRPGTTVVPAAPVPAPPPTSGTKRRAELSLDRGSKRVTRSAEATATSVGTALLEESVDNVREEVTKETGGPLAWTVACCTEFVSATNGELMAPLLLRLVRLERLFIVKGMMATAKRSIPGAHRPALVATWITAGRCDRKAGQNLDITKGNLQKFKADVLRWWNAMQPAWRVKDDTGWWKKESYGGETGRHWRVRAGMACSPSSRLCRGGGVRLTMIRRQQSG